MYDILLKNLGLKKLRVALLSINYCQIMQLLMAYPDCCIRPVDI